MPDSLHFVQLIGTASRRVVRVVADSPTRHVTFCNASDSVVLELGCNLPTNKRLRRRTRGQEACLTYWQGLPDFLLMLHLRQGACDRGTAIFEVVC